MPRYKKYNDETKNQVVQRFLEGEDWQVTARKNCIPSSTVRSWVKKKRTEEAEEEAGEVVERRARGGARRVKITDEHKHFLEELINDNPSVTLKELQAKLALEMGLTVCLTTVGNAVNGMMYSYKKMHHEPATMNSLRNKEKRRDFRRTLTEAIGNGKRIVWQDETNFNVWCTRSTGWSRVGRRAVAAHCTSKGQNLHIIWCD